MKNRILSTTPMLLSAIASAALAGCTNLINQNTDGNQVYTGVEGEATIATDDTGGPFDGETSGGTAGTASADSSDADSSGSDPDAGTSEAASTGGSSGSSGIPDEDTSEAASTGGSSGSSGPDDGGSEVGDTGGSEDSGDGGGAISPIDGDPITDKPGEVYAVSLALGWGTTYALLNNGEIKAWGNGNGGALGYGDELHVVDPSVVGAIDLGFRAKQVVAGRYFACALAADGEAEEGCARCWGVDSAGNLGRGFADVGNPAIGDDEPVSTGPLISLESPIVALAAGEQHVCALMADQRATCWGRGGQGQLGLGNSQNIGDDELPGAAGAIDMDWPVTSMWAGGHMSCLGGEDGDVVCFGEGQALGNGSLENIGDDELPKDQPPLAFGFPIRQLAIGLQHMCALGTPEAGSPLECVGFGLYGALGGGNIANQFDAAAAVPVSLPFAPRWIDAMENHTCGSDDDGRTMCFGWGGTGNLGYASTENVGDDDTPAEWGAVVTGIDVVRVYTGWAHTCVLSSSAQVECWGSGYLGYPVVWGAIGDDEVPASAGLVPYL